MPDPILCPKGHDLTAVLAKGTPMRYCPYCPSGQPPLRTLTLPPPVNISGRKTSYLNSQCSLAAAGPLELNIDVEVFEGSPWLSVSSTHLHMNGYGKAEITVIANPALLPSGQRTFQGKLAFRWDDIDALGNQSSLTVPVTVNLEAAALQILPEAQSLAPGVTSGSFQIHNTGNALLSGSIKKLAKAPALRIENHDIRVEPGRSQEVRFTVDYERMPNEESTVQAELLIDCSPDATHTVTVGISRETRKGTRIGIDFGTTKCCVAYVNENGSVSIIEIDYKPQMPSVVTFRESTGEIYVGEEALNMEELPEPNVFTVKSIKRDIIDENRGITFRGRYYTPIDIAAEILKYLVRRAEETIGPVSQAVITHPDGWIDRQMEATKEAARRAHLKIALESEAIAAAYASAKRLTRIPEGIICVFDFGGGTLDVALIRKLPSPIIPYEEVPKGKGGDRDLGGDRIDEELMNLCFSRRALNFNAKQLRDQARTSKEYQFYLALKKRVEEAKIQLSRRENVVINLDGLTLPDGRILQTTEPLDRPTFNNLLSPLFDSAVKAIHSTLTNANLNVNDIDAVLMVGGSSNIPEMIQRMEKEFGKSKVIAHPEPHLAIASGAALFAYNAPVDSDAKPSGAKGQTRYPTGIRLDRGLFRPLLRRGTPYGEDGEPQEFYVPNDYETSVNIDIFQYTNDDWDPATEEAFIDGEEKEGWIKVQSRALENLPPLKKGEILITVTPKVEKDGTLAINVKWENRKNPQMHGESIDLKNRDFRSG